MQTPESETARRVAIVIVSDRAASGVRADESAPVLRQRLTELGFATVLERVVPDGIEPLATLLADLADGGTCELIVTSGGTGLSPRDLTPEATRRVGERDVPGLMEVARLRCGERTPFAALSRSVAMTRARTLIVNLPGHPKAALETLDAIAQLLPHATRILSATPTDCSLTGRSEDTTP